MTATTDGSPTSGSRTNGSRTEPPIPTVGERFAFLRSPGWIAGVLGTVIGALLCLLVLAPWQFSRHHQRDAQNAAITAAIGAPAVPLDQRLPAGATADPADIWRVVSATGEFLPTQVGVGLRQNQAGQASLELLAPLRLPDGTILVVDRGYLQLSDYTSGQSLPAPPSGTVTVTGRLQPFQPDPVGRPAVNRGTWSEVRGITAASLPGMTGPVRGGFIQLTEQSPGVVSAIGVPQRDDGPFLSYAWQWLGFGTMALLAMGFFIYREASDPRDPANEGEGVYRDESASTLAARAGHGDRTPKFDRRTLYDA